jgi:hypothetical protein
LIGAEFCKRNRVNDAVVNAIASHHHETDRKHWKRSLWNRQMPFQVRDRVHVVKNLEQYIKRLKTLKKWLIL